MTIRNQQLCLVIVRCERRPCAGSERTDLPLAKANGVELCYEQTGDRGAPMVLIHGSWIDHSNWGMVVPGLSKSFRVLTYDRRGHGKSQKVASQGSFDEDAEDAADLLHQLGLAPAHIVGNSGGSVIALKMAVRRPEVFRSLNIHEPPAFDLLKGDPSMGPMLARLDSIGKVVKALQSGDKVGGARMFAEFVTGPGGWDRMPPQQREAFIANADTFLDESKDPLGLTVDLKALSGFSRPTMLTYGGKSPASFRPVVDKVAAAIHGAKVFSFDDAGHMPHVTHPDKFVATATEFAMSSE